MFVCNITAITVQHRDNTQRVNLELKFNKLTPVASLTLREKDIGLEKHWLGNILLSKKQQNRMCLLFSLWTH